MDLPKVVTLDKCSNGVQLELSIDSSLDVFDGHFNDMPIVAGVVQVAWAIEFCCQHLQKIPPQQIDSIEALKFLHIITPSLVLSLKLEIKNNKLIFSFYTNEKKYSSGKIVLI